MRMMPRLNAEEAIEAWVRTAVGTGSLEKDSSERQRRLWQEATEPPRPRRIRRRKATPANG